MTSALSRPLCVFTKMGVEYFKCPVANDDHARTMLTRACSKTGSLPTRDETEAFLMGHPIRRWGRTYELRYAHPIQMELL